MKTLIITALAALSLTSCERKYRCIETQIITTNGVTTVSTGTRTFTGTKKELDKFISDNTSVEIADRYKITTSIDCK